MKNAQRIVCFLLCTALCLAVPVSAATVSDQASAKAALTGLSGQTVISWNDFYRHATADTGTAVGTMTRVTGAEGDYSTYIQYEVLSTGTSANTRQLIYNDNGKGYGFEGTVAAGDVLLLRLVIRAVGTEGKMSATTVVSGVGSTSKPTGSFAIPTQWTELYIPMQGAGSLAGNWRDSKTLKRYLTVQGEDGTYSFHRFYLGITKISVKPSHTAVGYKAVFAGSDTVKSQLKSYGFKLWITSDNPVVAAKDGSQMESLKEVSLRLQHFDVESYGTTDVFGTVFMELQDGTVIQGDTYSYNLRDLLQSISLDPSAYSDEQMTALRDMCLKYADIMANWSIDNILGFTAA